MKLLDFIVGLFKPKHGFCKEFPIQGVPALWVNGEYLSFKEWKFLTGLKRLPTDEELVVDITKMVERTKMKFGTILIYKWSGMISTTRIRINPGDKPYPAKTENIISALFDLSLGNSICGVEFVGSAKFYDIVIYVEESKDGATNITPLFMDFIHGFMETKRSKFTS